MFGFQFTSPERRHAYFMAIYDVIAQSTEDLNMKSTEDDLSLALFIFISNMNYKWLKAHSFICTDSRNVVF